MKTSELTSKDLMIEDWLQDSFGNIGQVYRLDPGRVHLRLLQERPQDEEYIVHDIKPIPLTPEILEKNRFELDKIIKDYIIYNGINNRVSLHNNQVCMNSNNEWNVCIDSEDYSTIAMCELTYVHELQHVLRLCKINKKIVV